MIIHATNSSGIGASHVITSFIKAANKMKLLKDATLYLPLYGPLKKDFVKDVKTIRYKRFLPNSLSRVIECLLAKYIFPKDEFFIVLGDIPLRGINSQVVLVHQPHLVYPSINNNSSKNLKYKLIRFLFKINLKYAKTIIVQTETISKELILSYPSIINKINVMPQPSPFDENFKLPVRKTNSRNKKPIFIYPAGGYKHKNHSFLIKLEEYFKNNNITANFEIWVTLTEDEFTPFNQVSFIKNLGRKSINEIYEAYQRSDALLFLSSAESYGLPLLEAMEFSLPIIVADLPYSRWMCENSAYYFKHNSITSFLETLEKLSFDINSGIVSDYSNELKKIPKSWNEVVQFFIKFESDNE